MKPPEEQPPPQSEDPAETLTQAPPPKSDTPPQSVPTVATALAKCKDRTMEYLHNNSLDDETFNKAIQKCIESRRIDEQTKAYLRTLKRRK